jgi:hypothetical protein
VTRAIALPRATERRVDRRFDEQVLEDDIVGREQHGGEWPARLVALDVVADEAVAALGAGSERPVELV